METAACLRHYPPNGSNFLHTITTTRLLSIHVLIISANYVLLANEPVTVPELLTFCLFITTTTASSVTHRMRKIIPTITVARCSA